MWRSYMASAVKRLHVQAIPFGPPATTVAPPTLPTTAPTPGPAPDQPPPESPPNPEDIPESALLNGTAPR